MSKKIIAIIGSISIMISSTINVGANHDTTTISERKVFLYPIFTSLSVKQDIPQGSEGAVASKQFTLADDENSLSVSFKFKSETEKKDIMFVSVYDITENRYITSDKGVAVVAERCVFTGLTPGHEYMIRTSALFNEKTVDVVVSTIKNKSAKPSENTNTIFNISNSTTSDFDDIASKLKELKIINGYEDGSVRPNNKITRAEVCAIINRTIHQGKSSMTSTNFDVPFVDIVQDAWYYDDVMKAKDFGLVDGYENNIFRPQNDITYNEYIKIITSLLHYSPYAETNGRYPDGYIAAADNAGILKGIVFDGNDKITRKDAMTILYKAINSPILLVKSYNIGTAHEYEMSDTEYIDFIE